jgi:HPt (histidine-containing phosphotransfer) domain-containing protein
VNRSKLYAEHAPQSAIEIANAFAESDLERLGKAAHALKSMSLNIGARRVAAAASEIERVARHDRQPPSADLVADVKTLVAEACEKFEIFKAAA